MRDLIYPLDAIPGLQRRLCDEQSNSRQGDLLVPAMLQAFSSLAVSGIAEAHLPGGHPVPLSSYSVIQAESGEGKTHFALPLMEPFLAWSQAQAQNDAFDRRQYQSGRNAVRTLAGRFVRRSRQGKRRMICKTRWDISWLRSPSRRQTIRCCLMMPRCRRCCALWPFGLLRAG